MTETEPNFASPPARKLAEQYPGLKLPKRGKVTIAQVRAAIEKANPPAASDEPVDQVDDAEPVPEAAPEPALAAASDAADAEPKTAPKKGDWGSKGYTGPQPWESDDAVVIDHRMPTLASGSDGPAVLELGARLAKLGYESSVSRGENPFAILDPTLLDAVRDFRADFGVHDDYRTFADPDDAANHVGPFTWEALLRATA